MKPFLILAVLIAILTVVYISINEAQAPVREDGEKQSALGMLESATLQVPESDATVTLKEGEALFEVAPGAAVEGSISLIPGTAVEWTNGARKDVAAAFAVNSGGSGVFVYMVLFDASGSALIQKSEAYLGDRITVSRVGIGELVQGDADYRITVQTMVRKEGEAYAAVPSVPEARTFYVKEQKLQEVTPGRDDT